MQGGSPTANQSVRFLSHCFTRSAGDWVNRPYLKWFGYFTTPLFQTDCLRTKLISLVKSNRINHEKPIICFAAGRFSRHRCSAEKGGLDRVGNDRATRCL